MKTRSKFRTLSLALVLFASAAPLARQARADTVALAFTGGSSTDTSSNSSAGYTFTLSNSVSVTQLGFFDNNSDGLTQSIPVTIWSSTGTALINGTVPTGTAGALTNGFRYVTLSLAVNLPAGNYTISGYRMSGSDAAIYNTTSLTTASGVAYGQTRLGNDNAYPTSNKYGDPNGEFGPNFQFNAATPAPEPSTWAMLGAGAGLLGVVTLRRRAARA